MHEMFTFSTGFRTNRECWDEERIHLISFSHSWHTLYTPFISHLIENTTFFSQFGMSWVCLHHNLFTIDICTLKGCNVNHYQHPSRPAVLDVGFLCFRNAFCTLHTTRKIRYSHILNECGLYDELMMVKQKGVHCLVAWHMLCKHIHIGKYKGS